jgi:hypothetical protein
MAVQNDDERTPVRESNPDSASSTIATSSPIPRRRVQPHGQHHVRGASHVGTSGKRACGALGATLGLTIPHVPHDRLHMKCM